jgi:hypothetical protein
MALQGFPAVAGGSSRLLHGPDRAARRSLRPVGRRPPERPGPRAPPPSRAGASRSRRSRGPRCSCPRPAIRNERRRASSTGRVRILRFRSVRFHNASKSGSYCGFDHEAARRNLSVGFPGEALYASRGGSAKRSRSGDFPKFMRTVVALARTREGEPLKEPKRRILDGESETRGRCFCGAVQLELSGEPSVQVYCHCSSCRGWLRYWQ